MYDIVVAKYNENLDWVNNIALPNKKINKIFIYCKNEDIYPISNKKIIFNYLKNIGRESHTYLHHIINNYNNLSEKIIFTQAKYTDHASFDDFFINDYVSIFRKIKMTLFNFCIDNYYGKLEKNPENLKLGEWIIKYIEKDDVYFVNKYGRYVKFGACFTVHRNDIHSRSLDYYKQMIKQLENSHNPEVGHFFERSWYYIFNLHKKYIYKRPNNIVIGGGFSGIVLAEQIANQKNQTVLIIEQRSNIAGNCYDYVDESTNILVAKYGLNILHTNREDVWDYVNKYSTWTYYTHNDSLLKINICTINNLCNLDIKNENDMNMYLDSVRDKTIISPINNEEYCLSKFGKDLYEKVIKNRMYEKFRKFPNELDLIDNVIINYDEDVCDKYIALPNNGYSLFANNIINNTKIYVLYSTKYQDIKNDIKNDLLNTIWHTGKIDSDLFNIDLPKLQYSYKKYEFETINNIDYYQDYPIIEIPNNRESLGKKALVFSQAYIGEEHSFSCEAKKIIEFKHLLNQKSNHTIIAKEFIINQLNNNNEANNCTLDDNDYVCDLIKNEENIKLYNKYIELVNNSNIVPSPKGEASIELIPSINSVVHLGRYSNYLYYDINDAISNSLDIVKKYNFKDKKKFITIDYNYLDTNIYLNANNLIKLKANNDAHIGLFFNESLLYEIVIGGWNNTKSCIRYKKQGKTIYEIDHKYCNSKKYVPIYLKIVNNTLHINGSDSSNNNIAFFLIELDDKINFNEIKIKVASWDKLCKWII